MEAKEYLQQIKLQDIKIKQMLKQRDLLRGLTISISGMDYTGDKVQQSGTPDRIGNMASRYLDLEAEIDQAVDQYIDLKMRIIGQIQSLDNVQHVTVLYLRYVEYKRLEEIAVECGYAYRHVKRIHGQALEAFGEKFL